MSKFITNTNIIEKWKKQNKYCITLSTSSKGTIKEFLELHKLLTLTKQHEIIITQNTNIVIGCKEKKNINFKM